MDCTIAMATSMHVGGARTPRLIKAIATRKRSIHEIDKRYVIPVFPDSDCIVEVANTKDTVALHNLSAGKTRCTSGAKAETFYIIPALTGIDCMMKSDDKISLYTPCPSADRGCSASSVRT